MYFPIGWPRSANLCPPQDCNVNGKDQQETGARGVDESKSMPILQINFDAVKLLLAAIGVGFLGIWYARPLIPIVYYRRTRRSIERYGGNRDIIWKPDSRQLLIVTSKGVLLLYRIDCVSGIGGNRSRSNHAGSQGNAGGSVGHHRSGHHPNSNNVFIQIDSFDMHLRRDSAELFIKEDIPQLSLSEQYVIEMQTPITTVCCISLTELLMANADCQLIRLEWSQLTTELTTIASGSISSSSPKTQKKKSNPKQQDDGYIYLSNELVNALEMIPLRQIQFYVSQYYHLKNVAPIGSTAYVRTLEYSPFIGGYAVIFSDNRAAFLMANHYKFETSNIHGFWIPEIEDATVCCVNHKFRLLAFGRKNSDVSVYGIDDSTGSLEFSHRLTLNSLVMPATLGSVNEMKWSPDGCVIIVAWSNGGFALWSTFGALLMSSHNWDFGVNIDLKSNNPLLVDKMEWSTEGYQLFITCQTKHGRGESSKNFEKTENNRSECSNVMQFNFVKSTLTMNPCMASYPHILLQDDHKLYLNQGNVLESTCLGEKFVFPQSSVPRPNGAGQSDCYEINEKIADSSNRKIKSSSNTSSSSILAENKYWTLLHLPETYLATNWPIRYSSIDAAGLRLAVAGRTGLAHYSLQTKKWKLFGNELQEKDFMVSGGLLWWNDFIIAGCYSLFDYTDEIRCYSSKCRLDNQYSNRISVRAPIIRLNVFRDQLINLTADGTVSIFAIQQTDTYTATIICTYEVDLKGICIHPACIVSLTLTNLRNDFTMKNMIISSASTSASANTSTTNSMNTTNNSSSSSETESETIIVNVCGRILMVPKVDNNSTNSLNSLMASCLASCVECFWISHTNRDEGTMNDCLWLFSGIHGMRVWLPILPPVNPELCDTSHRHTFMSKRIMLSFPLKLYPLVILFDNVIALGVENETTLYTNETTSHFVLPFSQLERKSLVYLHKILRQLIKRNLGYNAWEIAQSCRHLPYFPHSLELLLHEVLEEEATSKEPIPDALLPRVLDFIREFPVYLQTIVQCARKTEIALWPYLFSIAGEPKDLFQQCLESENLVTAASYLIILQNLEPTVISKQYAILLLEISLQHRSWELAKDLIRFLKAIDPSEIDSPRSSMVVSMKIVPQTPTQSQVAQNPEVFNLVLGPTARERSFSTTVLSNASMKERKEKPSTFNVTNQNDFKRINEHHRLTNVSNSNLVTGTNIVSVARSTGATASNASMVVRRKSEHNNTVMDRSKEKREVFSVEIILNRIARRLLLDYKIFDLGYMSAYLDFHLVAWLSQEDPQATCIQDYVIALTSLHEELQLMSPIVSQLNEVTCEPECISLDKHTYTFSHSSESGYFSSANVDTPTSYNNSHMMHANVNNNNNYSNNTMLTHTNNQLLPSTGIIPAIKEHEVLPSIEQHCRRIKDDTTSSTTYMHCHDNDKLWSNMLIGLNKSSYRHYSPSMDDDLQSNVHLESNTVSETDTTSGDSTDIMDRTANINSNANATGISVDCHLQPRILPNKFAIKIRYLLQLFIEANCIDFALVLSILLQDIASTGRIINVIIRSEPLTVCLRILNSLKRVTQWAFENECVYRSIMIAIQPHIYHLDQYLQAKSMNNNVPSHHLLTMINNGGNMNCNTTIINNVNNTNNNNMNNTSNNHNNNNHNTNNSIHGGHFKNNNNNTNNTNNDFLYQNQFKHSNNQFNHTTDNNSMKMKLKKVNNTINNNSNANNNMNNNILTNINNNNNNNNSNSINNNNSNNSNSNNNNSNNINGGIIDNWSNYNIVEKKYENSNSLYGNNVANTKLTPGKIMKSTTKYVDDGYSMEYREDDVYDDKDDQDNEQRQSNGCTMM